MTLNILSAENMAAPRSTVPTCTEGRQTVVSGELAPATPMQTAIPGTGEEAILIGPDKTRGPVFEIFDITKCYISRKYGFGPNRTEPIRLKGE